MHSILIVEDDMNINGLLKEALEKADYLCTQAFSGTEARMLLAMNRYSVVLLDLMLPGISWEGVQKERFFNEDDYLRLRDTYILDEAKMSLAKKDMAVLHPLPRVNEIAVEVDDDPRAAYFEQVKNGMLMRMALESSVVGDRLPGYEPLESEEVAA